jgi:hypothetical protein
MTVYCSDEIMDRCKYSQASHYKKSHEKDKRTCDYILKTGHSRPCHWKECTVFEEREEERRV